MVLQTLQNKQSYDKSSKCQFQLDKVTFFGHIISTDGIYFDPHKLEVVLK